MNININRYCYSKHGVDGTLSINGQHVCDTCEHPTKYITPGNYRIHIAHNKAHRRKVPYILPMDSESPFICTELNRSKGDLEGIPFIKIGNGPFKLLDGSIIIGKHHIAGVLIHSADTFARLIDRLDKAQNRGDEITLTIK